MLFSFPGIQTSLIFNCRWRLSLPDRGGRGLEQVRVSRTRGRLVRHCTIQVCYASANLSTLNCRRNCQFIPNKINWIFSRGFVLRSQVDIPKMSLTSCLRRSWGPVFFFYFLLPGLTPLHLLFILEFAVIISRKCDN